MRDRQKFWKKNGYTDEQIENHLRYERYKAKEIREKRKRNNEDNKELIKKIKDDLIGKTFFDRDISMKILTVNPTVDGVGFWFKMHRVFPDKSEGDFRYFKDFEGYNREEFIEDLKYL